MDWPPARMAEGIPSSTKRKEEDEENSASPSFPRSPPPLSLPLRMEKEATVEGEEDYPQISSLDELNAYDGAVIAKVHEREREGESVVKMKDGGGGDQVEGNLVTIVCDGSVEGQTKCRTKSIPSSSTKSNSKSASSAISSSASKRSRRSEDSAAKRNSSAAEAPAPTKPTKKKIHWRDSGLTGLNSAYNPGRSYVPPSPLSPGVARSTLSPEVQREREKEEFYRNYDPMEGVVTAVVLGGFFAFVCLLVVYKTKCKPMWKNRRKRLHNTPATRSVADNDMGKGELGVVADLATEEGGDNGIMDEQEVVVGIREPIECCDGVDYDYDEDEDDYLDEEYEYECIPLRSVFSGVEGGGGYVEGGGGTAADGDEESDMYFLDEFGNYVFPVMAPSMPGSCLCHPHEEEEEPDPSMSMAAAFRRRQSQVCRYTKNI